MRIGVLCSGGDSPGVNAALRGLVLRGTEVHGFELLGFSDGWRGFHEREFTVLQRSDVQGISPLGGVSIGTSRVPPFPKRTDAPVDLGEFRARMREYGLDGFFLIGGNGTQTVSRILHEHGIPVIGLPKTIDNDLGGTDATFGFDTAVSIAAEAIDRLRTTASSHQRAFAVETMGRDCGYIALMAGIAGGAEVIALPESEIAPAEVAERLRAGYQRNPDVSLEVDRYRPVFIMGEVGAAGQYSYVPGMTVQKAVAAAGGYTPRANQGSVDITRDINGKVITGRVLTSDPLMPGDTVYVRERLF